MLELCRRANLTGFGGASTRRLPAAQEGAHPSSAAGTEVTPPPSSAASATVLEDNSDPVDMDSGLTSNEASVINSDGMIVWFTKLTVLFYLESGWVGGVCWVVASRVFCLKNKRANRILEFANNSISERGFLQFLHWCNFRHVSVQWS